jgi:hypothetical protein
LQSFFHSQKEEGDPILAGKCTTRGVEESLHISTQMSGRTCIGEGVDCRKELAGEIGLKLMIKDSQTGEATGNNFDMAAKKFIIFAVNLLWIVAFRLRLFLFRFGI